MVIVLARTVVPGEPLAGLNETLVPTVGAPDCVRVTVAGNPPAPAVMVIAKTAV
jgi:hypothetical protein